MAYFFSWQNTNKTNTARKLIVNKEKVPTEDIAFGKKQLLLSLLQSPSVPRCLWCISRYNNKPLASRNFERYFHWPSHCTVTFSMNYFHKEIYHLFCQIVLGFLFVANKIATQKSHLHDFPLLHLFFRKLLFRFVQRISVG